ncbi:hypothetical protein [Pseudomonas indica]|uniref:Uncharacterized protein n=1 Tax=Pseudomonas indica TaxID=137658 RepID=A0A1G8V1W9_9PSED|nr:hypothetical protein [Pseudomonas indica]SDJ60053.1 hypothetical protein SAMN05216186_10271 [Pseudomonas indica]
MTLTYPTLSPWIILIACIAIGVIMFWVGYRSGRIDGSEDGEEEGRAKALTDLEPRFSDLEQRYRATSEANATLRARLSAAEAAQLKHKAELEAVQRDADNRVALFAHRANPFTADDGHQLDAIAMKLELAANTFAGINCADHARFARTLAQHALNMAARLGLALQAASKPLPTSPEHPDTTLIQWLSQHAEYAYDDGFSCAELRFSLKSPPGTESLREIIHRAQMEQEARDLSTWERVDAEFARQGNLEAPMYP